MSVRLSLHRALLAIFAVVFLGLTPKPAWAHKPSDSYLTLTETDRGYDVRWDIALRDIDDAIGLGAAGPDVRGADLDARRDEISAWAFKHLAFRSDLACTLKTPITPARVAEHSDGTYLVLRAEAECPSRADVVLYYDLLFDVDAQHRGIVRIADGPNVIVRVASTRDRSIPLPTVTPPSIRERVARVTSVVREGVFHILTGYDHVLFLIALLLPAVLRRNGRAWEPREAWRPVVVDVAKIVTAFTVAHSLTLGLAGLGLVSLPSRLVESAIAASVMVAALNNIWPFFPLERWTAAFVLGLMHGFGFSSALADAGASGTSLVVTLLGFNVGVELGQLAVVAVLLPLAFWMRGSKLYAPIVLRFGSAAIFSAATVWFAQRAFLF